MTQYKTQYGTIFAVKEHNGAPAIMCRAELSETWSLSSMITPFIPGAWTAEELQGQLDNWAATKGWQPVEAPASAEWPEIVDEGSGPDEGFPDWVRPMVEAFLQFPFFRELPAFTSSALRNSDPARHHHGGTLADGLYDTGPKGIALSVFRGDNSDRYRKAHYTWADFVRRCKAAGLAPEQLHQDKEDTPCNTETPVPTGAAAATTDASAAPEPSQAAETSTGSPGDSADASSCPSAEPAPQAPAALPLSAPDTAPTNLPAFDYAELPQQAADALRMAEHEILSARQTYISRLSAAVASAHEVVVANCDKGADGKFAKQESTFLKWCASVGLKKDAAYRLLQVNALLTGATAEEQAVLEAASPSLLYAAAKPSAPAELVQAVKGGDITTHKQYQDLLARYNAERAAREKAERDNDVLRADSAKARDAAHTYHRQYEEVAAQRNELLDQRGENISLRMDAEKQRDAALRRAAEAEKQRDGARDALTASKLRGDKLKAENEALKARPIEAGVVDEEEIERRAQARADELTAPMRKELEALRARHPADLEEAEQDIRNAYDSAIYTGRVMENAWHTLRPLLPRMDAHRRELALTQITKIISTIQGECIKCL